MLLISGDYCSCVINTSNEQKTAEAVTASAPTSLPVDSDLKYSSRKQPARVCTCRVPVSCELHSPWLRSGALAKLHAIMYLSSEKGTMTAMRSTGAAFAAAAFAAAAAADGA